MLIAPIILATVAVVLLVYGTSTQTVTHIINDDARPASLGGSQASTGESVDTSHKTARSEPATVTTHTPKQDEDEVFGASAPDKANRTKNWYVTDTGKWAKRPPEPLHCFA